MVTRKFLFYWVYFAGLIAVFISGCNGPGERDVSLDSPPDAASIRRPIRVVATSGMVADLVREIGGDLVRVEQLFGAGVDPHLYKPTRDDVRTIMRGDLVFYSGLMLEGKMNAMLVKIGRKKPVRAITDSIPHDRLFLSEDSGDHPDPHVWMDVSLWSECVQGIVDRLAKYDPLNSDDYQNRADHFRSRLEALHHYGLDVIRSIPEESRVLITSHDAFNYMGRAYGLEVLGVQGLSTESEAGLQRINELVDLIVHRRVKAVFVESSVSQKNLIAMMDGARSRGVEISIGGELYSDAMGTQGTYEGTYLGMLDHNFTTVSRALGGDAPLHGFDGKLNR